jgi:hypothetical protein
MLVSLVSRREQMVSDGVTVTYDQDHWNTKNSGEEPIQPPMDLTFDKGVGAVNVTRCSASCDRWPRD